MKLGLGLSVKGQFAGEAEAGASYDADTEAAITRMETAHGSALSTEYKAALDTFILALKADSTWDEITGLWLFKAKSQAHALVNVKNGTNTLTLATGSINFTANDSIDFGGSTTSLLSNVVPPQNDMHFMVQLGTYTWESNRDIVADGGLQNRLFCSSTTNTGLIGTRSNSSSNMATVTTYLDLTGCNFINRDNALNYTYRLEGNARETITRGSVTVTHTGIKLGTTSNSLSQTPYKAFSVGTSMTSTQQDTLIAALNAFYADASAWS
jgi:hypothetical protein